MYYIIVFFYVVVFPSVFFTIFLLSRYRVGSEAESFFLEIKAAARQKIFVAGRMMYRFYS